MESSTLADRSRTPGASDREVIILGLDGATLAYILPLVENGELPNLASLLRQGVSAVMKSTCPPISAPAWITFMTGENPGRHGIFEFWSTDLTRYNPLAGEALVTSDLYKGKTLFDIISSQGWPVSAIRVPATFPAWPINGFMVSGYPAPWGADGTFYPPTQEGLRVRPKNSKAGWLTRYRGSQEEMRLALFREQLELTASLASDTYQHQAPRLFMVVFNQLDAVGHHFPRHRDPTYPSYDPKRSPRYRGVIDEFHRRLDDAVGRLLSVANPEALALIVSDHGMGPRATKFFNVNYWLHTLGLLRPESRQVSVTTWASRLLNFINENLPIRQELRRFLPSPLKAAITRTMFNAGRVIWPQTKAYRVRMLPPIEGISMNVKGRQPSGTVDPTSDYEDLRDIILARLKEVQDPETQEPIVVQAWRREELYTGPYLERAPDIVFQLKSDYEAGVSLTPPTIAAIPPSLLRMRSGNHTMEGTFIAKGPGMRAGLQLGTVNLQDIAPTVLYYLGLPIPSNMDGRVIEEAFCPDFLEANPVRRGPPLVSSDGAGSGISAEDEEAMRDQLRGLGYL